MVVVSKNAALVAAAAEAVAVTAVAAEAVAAVVVMAVAAEAVAAMAVEKAIRTGQPEMIINFPALRPVFLIRDLFPRFGEKLILAFTFKFFRRAATIRK